MGRARTAIVVLLAALLLWFAALELAMRNVVPRLSEIWRREQRDTQAMLAFHVVSPGQPPTVLMVGNSLLLHGVDRAVLRRGLEPRYAVTVFPIENTRFFDWYFGMRRYFAEGTHPQVVVLCLSVSQLASDRTNGPSFAWLMMRMADLWRVRNASGLNRTQVSDYFFANISAWFGRRDTFRNAVLQKALPNAEGLVARFAHSNVAGAPVDEVDLPGALRHLRQLRELCAQHGARLVVLLPPGLGRSEAPQQLASQAAADGIPVVIPSPDGEMSAGDFSDGFHLNAEGAALFTTRLVQHLPPVLATVTAQR